MWKISCVIKCVKFHFCFGLVFSTTFQYWRTVWKRVHKFTSQVRITIMKKIKKLSYKEKRIKVTTEI